MTEAVGLAKEQPVRRRYPAAPLVGVAVAVFRPLRNRAQGQGVPGKGAQGQDEAGRLQTDGEVLLVRRKNPPRAGEWGLPGGLLRLGETLGEGARRELWEECGITAELGGLVEAFEPIQRDATGKVEYHFVVIEFWASYAQGMAHANDDAAEVDWIDMERLGDLAIQPDSQRVIQAAYRAWQAHNGQAWMAYANRE